MSSLPVSTPTRRNQSGVWRYFVRINATRAQCLMCHISVTINCGSTTRMRSHLEKSHPEYDYKTPIQHNTELPLVNFHERSITNRRQPAVESPCTSSSQEFLPEDVGDGELDPMSSLALVHNYPRSRKSRDKPSLVWQYFDLDELNHERVKCQICGKSLAYCGSSTTGMRLHLERKHELKDFQGPPRDPSLPTTRPPRNVPLLGFGRQYSLTQLVGDMCITDLQPASIITNEGFIQLLNCIVPNVTIPSEKRIVEYITSQCNVEKLAVEADLATSHVTLSVEMWESYCKTYFATITVHSVSEDWDVKSRVLSVSRLCNDIALANDMLRDVISDSTKEISVVAITHNVLGLASLEPESQPFYYCFTAMLQHCVAAGLKSETVAMLLQKAQAELTFFLQNNEPYRILEDKKEEMGIREERESNGTVDRWPAAYTTIDMLIKLRPAIDSAYNELSNSERELLIDDWCALEMLQAVIKPLYDTTEILASETFTPVSSILPIVYSLTQVHLKVQEEEDPLCTEFKKVVLENLNECIEPDQPTSLLTIATFLDPQHKSLSFFTEEKRKETQQFVTQLLSREQAPKLDSVENDENPTSTTNDQPVVKRRKLGDKMKALLGGMYGYGGKLETSNENQAEKEIFGYLSELLLPLGNDPLLWWQQKLSRFPLLSRMAVRHLSTSATATNPEYALASNADDMNMRRHMLPMAYLEEIVICHQNNRTSTNMNSSLEEEDNSMDNVSVPAFANFPLEMPLLVKQEYKESPVQTENSN